MILPYVYWLTHKESKQFYIGYREANKLPSDQDILIYQTSSCKIKEMKFENFNFIIVAEFFKGDDAYDFEQRLIEENIINPLCLNKHYTKHGKKKFGFNKGTKGHKLSEETKNKLRLRPHTWGDKIAKSLKGVPLTEIRRQKISESRKRFYQNHPEDRIAFNKNIPHTKEAKQRMSISLKIALAKPETIIRRSIANSGGNNPRAKRCMYNGQEFSCITEAEKKLGIYKAKLKRDLLFSFI